MMSGKKTSLTEEKMLKLAEIDFVFDGTVYRGRRRRRRNHHDDNSIDDGAISSLNMMMASLHHTGMQESPIPTTTKNAG